MEDQGREVAMSIYWGGETSIGEKNSEYLFEGGRGEILKNGTARSKGFRKFLSHAGSCTRKRENLFSE